MPRGASPKREREYDQLKDRFEHEGRYPGREKEVAARIVNKQRAAQGETKPQKRAERQGKAPDRSLPIEHFQHLTVPQVSEQLSRLSSAQLQKLKAYEQSHKRRKSLLERLERALAQQKRR